jgi:preprotein translocase subunit SecF
MEFFKHNTNIDFMQLRVKAMIFSLLLFAVSIFGMWHNGIELGLDFTGGTQAELHFSKSVTIPAVRQALEQQGIKQATVQAYGTSQDVLIRLKAQNIDKESIVIKQKIEAVFPDARVEQVEYIGPQVGKKLVIDSILAVIVSMLATMLYIALRFEMRFAISAIVSLVHDPILIMGAFAFLHLEFNLIALAALLTILGYSLNDTIVVYDRVRENFMRQAKSSAYDVVNSAINQTLSRTIMTSSLTLVVVVALFFLGGEALKGFALALIIGIIIGTYSSIYVAGSMAVFLGLTREALLPKKRIVDGMP